MVNGASWDQQTETFQSMFLIGKTEGSLRR